jgi:hypothetical protein
MVPGRTVLIILIAVMVFVSNETFADDAHSKSIAASSKARVVTPISLVNTDNQGLDFGKIAIGNTDSKVVVSATATVEADVSSGDAAVITSSVQTAAKFTVSGEAEMAYTITLPESMTVAYGSNTLTIDNFTCSNGTGGTIGTDDLFYIGAELSVPLDAVPGSYQGTFTVTVAYD